MTRRGQRLELWRRSTSIVKTASWIACAWNWVVFPGPIVAAASSMCATQTSAPNLNCSSRTVRVTLTPGRRQVKEHVDAQRPSGILSPTGKANTGGDGRAVTTGSTEGIAPPSSAVATAAGTAAPATAAAAAAAPTQAARIDQHRFHRRYPGGVPRAGRIAIICRCRRNHASAIDTVNGSRVLAATARAGVGGSGVGQRGRTGCGCRTAS